MSDVVSAAKCLTTGSLGENDPRFVVFTDYCGISAPAMASFKLFTQNSELRRDEHNLISPAGANQLQPTPG